MAEKKTDLTSQLLKLQALREKVRLTEEAQARQIQLRKESEGVTEKLVAENTKINAKLTEKKESLKRYQLIVDQLVFQKNQLHAKLMKLQKSLDGEQPAVTVPSAAVPSVAQNHNQSKVAADQTLMAVVPQTQSNTQTSAAVKSTTELKPETTKTEPTTVNSGYKYERPRETTSDDFQFKADEIWELRRSIEEIESQLQKTLEMQKQCDQDDNN